MAPLPERTGAQRARPALPEPTSNPTLSVSRSYDAAAEGAALEEEEFAFSDDEAEAAFWRGQGGGAPGAASPGPAKRKERDAPGGGPGAAGGAGGRFAGASRGGGARGARSGGAARRGAPRGRRGAPSASGATPDSPAACCVSGAPLAAGLRQERSPGRPLAGHTRNSCARGLHGVRSLQGLSTTWTG